MGIAKFNNNNNTGRKIYFDGIGTSIKGSSNLEEAIKKAGLDYEVEKRPIYYDSRVLVEGDNRKMPPKFTRFNNQYATVRTDTGTPLGVVGKNYTILQNREAFDFLDSLIVGGARFETAGTFKKNEAASFITVSTDPVKILDDNIDPYILLTNSFDGSGSIRCMFTPVRVWCSNTLALANKRAHNKVFIRHSNSLQVRMEQAKEILFNNTHYLEELRVIAEKLAVTPFSTQAFEELARELFPIKEDQSNIINERNLEKIEALLRAYKEDDIQNFNNTAWKAIQAVSDYESHSPVFRKTENEGFKNMQIVMAGMPLLNAVMERMMELAK